MSPQLTISSLGTHPLALIIMPLLQKKLPAPLLNSALMAIRGALAPNTKSTYGAGPLRFTQFCDKWAILEEDRMPADYALLCAFIGKFKGLQSGNTI